MLTLVVWCLVTLLLVATVFLVAHVMQRAEAAPGDVTLGGVRGWWRSFRSGLSLRRDAVPGPVDTDLDTFFAGTVEAGPAYVDAEEIGDVLQRAREQARSHLHPNGQPRSR
jgi:hypothetical protein